MIYSKIKRSLYAASVLVLTVTMSNPVIAEADKECDHLLEHSFRSLGGEAPRRLCDSHAGQVILVVNTASQCGYTYQYAALEHLYGEFREQGFVVIGFPSNDFGGQEPGNEQEIESFCRNQYSIQFPMYEKLHAKEALAHPFFKDLAQQAGEFPRWNFHKYLINRDGKVVGSWRSAVEPDAKVITERIKQYL